MPRTASTKRIDLHLSDKDAERLDAIKTAREDRTASDTLRALIREEHRRVTRREKREDR